MLISSQNDLNRGKTVSILSNNNYNVLHFLSCSGFLLERREFFKLKLFRKHPEKLNLALNIVNRRDWLGSPANIKGTNKDAKIYVGRSTTLHNLLFYAHKLCISYITNTFLLVSSPVQSKQLLCFVQGQGQKTEQ